MKILNKIALIFASLVLVTASCTNELEELVNSIRIENDALELDCTEQVVEQVMQLNGTYTTDCSAADWISIQPETGSSDGKGYITFTVNVEYNTGAERTGTVNIIHDGVSYPVTVTQSKCAFEYGEAKVKGLIVINSEIDATIVLPYSGASGKESVTISGTVTGDGAAGITVPEKVYNNFNKGEGELVINFGGTATNKGAVEIELTVDGKALPKIPGRVSDGTSVEGLNVGWNFYSAGFNPLGTDWDHSWTPSAKNPNSSTDALQHFVLPSSGNEDARLSAKSSTLNAPSGFTFNPGIQIQGMKENDYWLMTIPVMNVAPTQAVTVEASVGSAGSACGYYMLEYSADKNEWYVAPGAESRGEASILCHYNVTPGNASVTGYENTRKKYDKSKDDGYHKYTFVLDQLKETIYDGNLYFRLRVCANVRAVGTSAIADTKWSDLKGFEVTMVEGDPDADFVKLETTGATIDCMEKVIPVLMSVKGEWSVDLGGNDWLSVSQSSGHGTGEGFVSFDLTAAYNSGEARTAVINVKQGENVYPVTINQGECQFAYGELKFHGELAKGEEADATISIPYEYASGKEEAKVRVVVSGPAAAGIEFPEVTVSSFAVGKGEIEIEIKGTPVQAGKVNFEVFLNGESVGTVSAEVAAVVDKTGLYVGWNYYGLGLGNNGKGSEYDFWTSSSSNPSSSVVASDHYMLPSAGNKAAKLSAVSSGTDNVNDYSLNPGIQLRGMKNNDYWLMTIPVKNVPEGKKVMIESCVGGAGSGPSFWMLEYSADGTTWNEVPGARDFQNPTLNTTVKCHYGVHILNINNTGKEVVWNDINWGIGSRTTYDKATDAGYIAYELSLPAIAEGNLYFRLRICADVRANGGTAIGDAWADLKGFEVTPVDE